VAQNSIRKPRITEILPGDIVKRLRTIRRANAIYLHDDETDVSLAHHR
jgi:hypothetical protein